MPLIVPLLFLYYPSIVPLFRGDQPRPYGEATPAVSGALETFQAWQARAEFEMLASMFIWLLITIAMTLSAHAASDRTNSLTTKLDELFGEYARPGSPGASVMVIKSGKVLLAKGYGLANLEEKAPCGTNTNFRLASVTKQFTAMSVMILAERKKLSLDERLTDCFPEFPAYGSQITVRHLRRERVQAHRPKPHKFGAGGWRHLFVRRGPLPIGPGALHGQACEPQDA